jgi:hypothetical protein
MILWVLLVGAAALFCALRVWVNVTHRRYKAQGLEKCPECRADLTDDGPKAA